MRALLLLPLCAGCLSVTWERESRYSPATSGAIAHLEPGKSGLGECLADLGAPLWVWEHVEAGRPAAALAYGWFDERDFGVRVSVPVTENYSASFDYDQIDERMRGLVLFFDEHWVLTSWRTGLLRDLSREARRPPAYPARPCPSSPPV
jgi:hypothetical protein